MNQGILIQKQRPVALPYALLEPAEVPVPYGPQGVPLYGSAGFLPEFITADGYFQYSTQGNDTIGIPGTASFGVGSERSTGLPYLVITDAASGSVVNDVPSTAEITGLGGGEQDQQVDPYADATASGFTFNSVAFPIPEDGYSIGTAGALHFGIAFDLDEEEAIIDPIHTASLSVM